MSDQDANIEDLDPSTSSDQDAAADTQSADTANSSSANGEDDGLLSVVRDVVAESRADQTASPAEGEENGQQSGDAAQPEQNDENFSDVPFHKHPRFQQVLRQRDAYREDAERFHNVQSFIDNAGLSAEEAETGLHIMGLIKTNPVEAWKQMRPTVQNLLIAAGEVLPQDLQQMVQAGRMDQAAALEVSRARAGAQAVQVQRTFDQQRQERQTQRSAASAVAQSADSWEADRRRKDPNFDAKLVSLQKEVLFLQQTEGRPSTPEGVKEQLDKAYKAVNAALPKAPPVPAQRPSIKPVTGGSVAGNPTPEARSTLEIIRSRRRGQ